MEREVSLNHSSSDLGSTSGAFRQIDEIDDNNSLDLSRNDAVEPLRYNFERNINENLKSMTTHDGVTNSLKNFSRINKINNKNIENTKSVVDWLKSMEERMVKIEYSFKNRSDNLNDCNEKLEERLSRIEKKVTNQVEMKQLSETRKELQSDIGERFSEIEQIKDSVKSIVDQLSSLEKNYNSLSKECDVKLSKTESKIKSENDEKNMYFQQEIDILGQNLETAVKNLDEMRNSVIILTSELESLKKGISNSVETLSSDLNSLNNEMSKMKSIWQRNENQIIKNTQRCVELEKGSKDNLGKFTKIQNENKNLKESVSDVKRNLESQQRQFNDAVEKLSDTCRNQSAEAQKQDNSIKNAISKIKKMKQKVKEYDTKIGDMRSDIRRQQDETKRAEQNFIQIRNQELRERTTMETSKGNSGGGSGGTIGRVIGGVIGTAVGGPLMGAAASSIGAAIGGQVDGST